MPILNTPNSQVTASFVQANWGPAGGQVVRGTDLLALQMNVILGDTPRDLRVQDGNFVFDFQLIKTDDGTVIHSIWTGPLTQLPAGTDDTNQYAWYNRFWQQALWATNGAFGLFIFRPVMILGIVVPVLDGSHGMFAVGDDNYFMVVN